jgi:hypothetical protein
MRDLAPMTLLPSNPPADRCAAADLPESPGAVSIFRGVARLLCAHGMAPVGEVSLANGRRADVVAVASGGEIWIVEIKSSVEDFRADRKWPEYRAYCDRLFFAVAPAFPREILPADTGLIVADRYGGDVVRDAPEHRMSGARRKAVTLRVVHAAALRLHAAADLEIRRR